MYFYTQVSPSSVLEMICRSRYQLCSGELNHFRKPNLMVDGKTEIQVRPRAILSTLNVNDSPLECDPVHLNITNRWLPDIILSSLKMHDGDVLLKFWLKCTPSQLMPSVMGLFLISVISSLLNPKKSLFLINLHTHDTGFWGLFWP